MELTVAQKEKIVEIQVQAHLADPNRALCFYVTGAGYTRLIRDHWMSDMIHYTIQHLVIEGLPGITEKQALSICLGTHMLIGDSRVEFGLQLVEDDGRFADEYPVDQLALEYRKPIIEDKFIKLLIEKAQAQKELNLKTAIGEDILHGYRTDAEHRINKIQEKIDKMRADVQLMYKFTGDKMEDLYEKALVEQSSYFTSFEYKEIEHRQGVNEVKRELRKSAQPSAPQPPLFPTAYKNVDLDTFLERARKETNFHIPITGEDLKTCNGFWVSPRGEIFGGDGYPFIHRDIIADLQENGYFGQLDYEMTEEELERKGWIKKSGSYGLLFYPHMATEQPHINQHQIDAVIEWAMENEMEKIRFREEDISIQDWININDLLDQDEI